MAFFGWVLVNGVLKFNGTSSVTTGLFGDGSASAPSIAFSSHPTDGLYYSSGLQFVRAGTEYIGLAATGTIFTNSIPIGFSATNSGSADLFIVRDAANVLAQRNAANPQGLRIYNTFTSATDYERLEIGSSVAGQAANTFAIIPTKGSSGTLRDLIIGSSIGLTVMNSSRVNVIGKLDFTVAASTFAQTATMTNGPRAANPVNWVEVSYNGGTTGRIPIW